MTSHLTPWIFGNLTIHRATLNEIEAHARASYPSECCGFIVGPHHAPEMLTRSIAEINEADKYHAIDPVHFPRTSNTYFKINELRASRAFEAQSKQNEPIKVIYHSHCDSGAYFSEEDASTFARDGALMWPVAFLVTSVAMGEPQETKLWVHRAGTQTFDQSELTII